MNKDAAYNNPSNPEVITQLYLNDYSGLNSSSILAYDIDLYSNVHYSGDLPSFKSTNQKLTLEVWNDVAICNQVIYSPNELMPVVMRGDYLAKRMSSIVSTSMYGTTMLDTTDTIDICKDNCSCMFESSGVEARFTIYSVTPTKTYINN